VLACVVALGCPQSREDAAGEPANAIVANETSEVREPSESRENPSATPVPAGPGWCSADGWCWVDPDPHGNDLEGVWALAPDDAWAVGVNATVVHWDGEGWSRVAIDVAPGLDLHDVWAAGPERIFVAGHDGSVSSFDGRSTPIGEVERAEPSPTVPLRSLWGSSDHDAYALAPALHGDAMLFHYDGAAWTRVEPNPLATAAVVSGSAADDVFVFGDFGQVAHFDGRRWQQQRSPKREWLVHDAWVASVGENPRAVAVAKDDRFVIHDGRKWKTGATTRGLATDIAGYGETLTAVTGTASGEIWAGTHWGSLLVWTEAQWSVAAHRKAFAILDLASAGDSIFAVGEAGTQLVLPRGQPWNQPIGPRRHAALAIGGLGEHVWVADELDLWHFDGHDWTARAIVSRTRALWPVSPTEVHLVGEYGYRRFDGETLHSATLLPHSHFEGEDVWAGGSDDVWIAAGESLMHFDGQGWQAHTIDVEARSIHGSALDNLLVAGPRKQSIGESTRMGEWAVARCSGAAWTVELDVDDDRLFVRAHASEGGLAIDRYGRAWLRERGGWHEIESLPRSHIANYTILGAWMHGPTQIWAVDISGAIFHFDGQQWRVESSDLRRARAIGGTDSHVLVANSQGGVLRRSLPVP
jgi:hypothetical protein